MALVERPISGPSAGTATAVKKKPRPKARRVGGLVEAALFLWGPDDRPGREIPPRYSALIRLVELFKFKS